MPEVKKKKLTELTPDDVNSNSGSVRGMAMLERSLQDYGAGRSIVVDKNGKVIAGNKTLESAVSIGLDDAVVVHTNGQQLVVVQRDDLDLEKDVKAKELGLSDNRVGELNLTWAVDALQKIEDSGADLGKFFTSNESEDLIKKAMAFNPEFNPSIATGAITDADINKAQGDIDGRFSGTGEDTLIETQCPKCSHEFHIKPLAKKWQNG